RANAERFSVARFEQEIKAFVEDRLALSSRVHLARLPQSQCAAQTSPGPGSELPGRVVSLKTV
ncbi:Glycosyl transferase, group 1 protein, partial [Pseudomonas syringae pv. aptata]